MRSSETRSPFKAPVFSLTSLSDKPERVITVTGFNRFDAWLRACDEINGASEFIDEDLVVPA